MSSKRVRLFASLAAAIALSVVAVAATDSTQTSLILRGDFPAFYAAGKIILSPQRAELYNAGLQHRIELQAWPSLADQFYSFAYPPYVAALLAPFALLPPIAAKLIWTGLMAAVLFAACRLLAGHRLGPPAGESLVLCLLSAPVFFGVFSGQNVSLSMLLYAAIVCSIDRNQRVAGIAAGLWFFKPHYASLAVLYLALAGKWSAVRWAFGVAFAYYLLGAAVLGLDWPLAWLAHTSSFAARDYAANKHQMVSIIALAQTAIETLALSPGPAALVACVAVFASGILVLVTGRVILRTRGRSQQRGFMLLGPLIVLVSPHTLFYDAGLCLVSVAPLLASRVNLAKAGIFLALLAAFKLSQGLLPFDPLGPVIMLLFCWIYRRGAPEQGTDSTPL